MNNLKEGLYPIAGTACAALVILFMIPWGCTLIKSKKDIESGKGFTAICGRISGKFPGDGPIIVAACATDGGQKIANYTVVHDAGEYVFGVPPGKYYLFAYWDKNSNLIYDEGEPAGQYGDPKAVRASKTGVVYNIDIVIPEAGKTIEIPHGFEISRNKPRKLYSRQAGVIADLDDERFSEENGLKGFWEPGWFFNKFSGNIYFLDAYDPKKTPILFIHGATGTPRGWKYFVDHIDRTRFQPWFFYYPTGIRIDSMAYLLFWKLINLQAKYQFNKLYITAHSMGGLVARSFIVNYGAQFPCVKLFISLATPWGGDKMAEYGVKQSPVVIPSWIDMQPDGDFIKSLYRKKLPDSVKFYMFYGYRGNRNPLRSNNDGTITLSSVLDYRPQSEAQMNYAFDEDHTSILSSQDVLKQYNAVLDAFDEKESALPAKSGGYLKVRFSYEFDNAGVKPLTTLILRPQNENEKNGQIVINLSGSDNGRVLGPFPAGDYFASMVTNAAKTHRKYVPVAIRHNRTKTLDFVFEPDGEIRGCLTNPLKPEDKFTGRPDYRYRSVDEGIHIQSIVLEGNGIQRVIPPIQEPELSRIKRRIKGPVNYNYDLYILREDFRYKTCFFSFGLPAGDYTLTVDTEGYKTIKKKYSVKPGRVENFRVTELTPD